MQINATIIKSLIGQGLSDRFFTLRFKYSSSPSPEVSFVNFFLKRQHFRSIRSCDSRRSRAAPRAHSVSVHQIAARKSQGSFYHVRASYLCARAQNAHWQQRITSHKRFTCYLSRS